MAATRQVVSRGFRLYAVMYRLVAVTLFALAAVAWLVVPAHQDVAVLGWGALLGGGYLWFMSGLGLSAAAEYLRRPTSGGLALAFFVVMIVVFLAALASAAALWAGGRGLLPLPLGALLGLVLVAVGGGSYGLELAYLYATCEKEGAVK